MPCLFALTHWSLKILNNTTGYSPHWKQTEDQTWKIVFFHKPFFASPSHIIDMVSLYDTWWKAFDDYGIDMVFNGHIHNYARTKPINRNFATDAPAESYGSGENQGRCQIVTVSAPLRDAADPDSGGWISSLSRQNFCHVEIDGDRLSHESSG